MALHAEVFNWQTYLFLWQQNWDTYFTFAVPHKYTFPSSLFWKYDNALVSVLFCTRQDLKYVVWVTKWKQIHGWIAVVQELLHICRCLCRKARVAFVFCSIRNTLSNMLERLQQMSPTGETCSPKIKLVLYPLPAPVIIICFKPYVKHRFFVTSHVTRDYWYWRRDVTCYLQFMWQLRDQT
jgi:hypothetical protein